MKRKCTHLGEMMTVKTKEKTLAEVNRAVLQNPSDSKKKREPTVILTLFFETKALSKNRVVLIPEELVSDYFEDVFKTASYDPKFSKRTRESHERLWAEVCEKIEELKKEHGERVLDIPWSEWQVLSATCHHPRIRVFTRFYNIIRAYDW